MVHTATSSLTPHLRASARRPAAAKYSAEFLEHHADNELLNSPVRKARMRVGEHNVFDIAIIERRRRRRVLHPDQNREDVMFQAGIGRIIGFAPRHLAFNDISPQRRRSEQKNTVADIGIAQSSLVAVTACIPSRQRSQKAACITQKRRIGAREISARGKPQEHGNVAVFDRWRGRTRIVKQSAIGHRREQIIFVAGYGVLHAGRLMSDRQDLIRARLGSARAGRHKTKGKTARRDRNPALSEIHYCSLRNASRRRRARAHKRP